jgi:predicted DNA-binding transcriptional regulator AlpA
MEKRRYGLSKQKVARAFDISISTVDDLIKRGILPPPLKLGRSQQSRVRLRDDSIELVERYFRDRAG